VANTVAAAVRNRMFPPEDDADGAETVLETGRSTSAARPGAQNFFLTQDARNAHAHGRARGGRHLGSRLARHLAKLRKESHLVEIKVLGLDLAILNVEDRNAVNRDMVSGSW